MLRRITTAVTVVALAQGCIPPHHALPHAPTRTAPFSERLALYRTWRPTTMSSTYFIPRSVFSPTTRIDNHITLANGLSVAHPMDLVPLAGEDSPAGVAANRSSRLGTAALWTALGGVAITLAGGAAVGAGALSEGGPFASDNAMTMQTGGVLVGVGLVSILLGHFIFNRPAQEARREAFLSFDGSIRQRLGVCGDDVPEDCAASSQGSPSEARRGP